MTYRDENAPGLEPRASGATYERSANHSPALSVVQSPKIPAKWKRVLSAFLAGRSYHRFEAERELSDHTLHSTVSTIQGKGVRIERKPERVPGYLGIPTEVCRYWLDPNNAAAVGKARELLGETEKAAA